MTIEHVVIVGGGFSGTLLAINLLRHDGPRATLIERQPIAGGGLAFGAAHPTHLLNVRASNMSALPDDPHHFIRWMQDEGREDRDEAAGPQTFVPRRIYGVYLHSLLEEAMRDCGDRLTLVQGEVVDLRPGPQPQVMLADGRSFAADAVVLALGNLPPHAPLGIDPERLSPARYVADPWQSSAIAEAGRVDDVLVLGTGLTMVDVVLRLAADGHRGRITAMSRRGLLPRAHADAGRAGTKIAERPSGTGSSLLRQVRARATAIGWRGAVDELRPFTQDMWRAASPAEQARFLRHLRPWWDVHRHRLAPEVAGRIGEMVASGRLSVVAGKPLHVEEDATGLSVHWRPRGHAATARLAVQRIINCTGPQGDLLRSGHPLLQNLLERGAIRADACRIGIDVDAQARTLSRAGVANDGLLAIGPMTRGAFWEIVAVPDIRAQAWTLARRLSNAHWVAGEGL